MFKRLVMLVRGLMGSPSTAPSSLTAEQPSPSAKRSRAKSTQASPPTARKPRQPAKPKSKPKASAAQPTTQAASRKRTQKTAQAVLGQGGSQLATPALPIQSPAPTKRKPKTAAAPSTLVARKLGKKKPTARQVAMVSQSKPTGSKSKTAARPIRQHAK
jgi:hypothetical protein